MLGNSPNVGTKGHEWFGVIFRHKESNPTLERVAGLEVATQFWLRHRYRGGLVSLTACGVGSELIPLEFVNAIAWGPTCKILELDTAKSVLKTRIGGFVGRARRFDELPRLVSARDLQKGYFDVVFLEVGVPPRPAALHYGLDARTDGCRAEWRETGC